MRFDRSVGSVPKWFTALRKPSIWFFRYLLLKCSCNHFLSQGGNQEREKKKGKKRGRIKNPFIPVYPKTEHTHTRIQGHLAFRNAHENMYWNMYLKFRLPLLPAGAKP